MGLISREGLYVFIVVHEMSPRYFPTLIPINNDFYVNSEMALICAKFGADLIHTTKVTRRKKWPRFLAYPVYIID